MKPQSRVCIHRCLQQRVLTSLLVTALLFSTATARTEPGSDSRWMRAMAAIYQMILATETTSHNHASPEQERQFTGLSGSHSSRRLTRKDFKRIAKEYSLPGLTRGDRRQFDDNIWLIVQHAQLRTALHLHEQWGTEGQYRLRDHAENVGHVESCSFCEPVYQKLTEGTKLTCGSELLGYQEPTRIDSPNKWIP